MTIGYTGFSLPGTNLSGYSESKEGLGWLQIKGADYRRDQVVGAEIVESYGGRVMLAEILPGHSTTATLARLAR